MPLETATASWQSRTLAADEIWQAHSGGYGVLTTVETPTDDADQRGIRLINGEVRIFRSGQTVYFRAAAAPVGGAEIKIHRELHQ